MLFDKFDFIIDKLKFIHIFCKARSKTIFESNVLSFQKAVELFSYCLEAILQKINRRNKRLSTSKKDFVTIIVFNKVFVTIIILSNKTKIINNCVARYKKNSINCEVIFTCITIVVQTITNTHIYKRTNNILIEIAKLKKKSKS